MRSRALPVFAFIVAFILLGRGARADMLPTPKGPDAAYAACLEKEVGESCSTKEGGSGECVVVEGGPFGKAWPRMVCLNAPEIARGRQEGWIAHRLALGIGVVLLAIALSASALRRRRGRAQVDPSAKHT